MANISRGGEVVSRKAHNLEIVGSNPAPATIRRALLGLLMAGTQQAANGPEFAEGHDQGLKIKYMWYIYILECEDKSLYTGVTNNLERRFSEHKNRKGGHYTASHTVLKRLYSEEFKTRSDAQKREAQIKGWRREKKLALINNNMSA